jgi:hypothetical protein
LGKDDVCVEEKTGGIIVDSGWHLSRGEIKREVRAREK